MIEVGTKVKVKPFKKDPFGLASAMLKKMGLSLEKEYKVLEILTVEKNQCVRVDIESEDNVFDIDYFQEV